MHSRRSVLLQIGLAVCGVVGVFWLALSALLQTSGRCLPDYVVDVKLKGAKGDGITNDTAAIVSAIGNGRRQVVFPPGTYVIGAGDGINILVDDVTLVFMPGAVLKKVGSGST